MFDEMKAERLFLLLGGVVSLIFGILLFVYTQQALALVMLLVGLSWLIQGIFKVLSIFVDKTHWGWTLVSGVIGIVAGWFVLNNPVAGAGIAAVLFAIILGVFGVLIGAAALIGAFQGGGWGAGLFGLVSLLIGLLLIFNSVVGAEVLIWIVAALLVIQGLIGVGMGLFIKS